MKIEWVRARKLTKILKKLKKNTDFWTVIWLNMLKLFKFLKSLFRFEFSIKFPRKWRITLIFYFWAWWWFLPKLKRQFATVRTISIFFAIFFSVKTQQSPVGGWLTSNIDQQCTMYVKSVTYLNRFSAPLLSMSSLFISIFNLERFDCNFPRHVAARGSEPWKHGILKYV